MSALVDRVRDEVPAKAVSSPSSSDGMSTHVVYPRRLHPGASTSSLIQFERCRWGEENVDLVSFLPGLTFRAEERDLRLGFGGSKRVSVRGDCGRGRAEVCAGVSEVEKRVDAICIRYARSGRSRRNAVSSVGMWLCSPPPSTANEATK